MRPKSTKVWISAPQTMHVLGQAKPDRPLPLHERPQSAIVDQGAAHGLETSRHASDSHRTSIEPPAAAAVPRRGLFTQAKG